MFYIKRIDLFNYFIFIIIFVNMTFASKLISISDPSLLFIKKDFSLNHDLSVYANQNPFEIENTKLYNFNSLTSDVSIRLLPSISMLNRIPDLRLQGYITCGWENLSLLIEPVIVHKNYGESLLGSDFTRYNISGNITNAFIRYKMKNIVLHLGRSPVWWGQSWETSIIQSGKFPSYDHFDLKLNLGSIQIEMLMGQLSSDSWENNNRIKRYIAGHKVIWLPKHKKWIIGFGEQIIYTGENRGIEFHYFNPVLSYIPSLLNESTNTGLPGSDNDNIILFAFGRYNLQPNSSIYSELIIDEFQVDKSSSIPHSLGLKLGFDGSFNHLNSLLIYTLEYNKIDSWTYIHPGQFTSWENRQFPIGYFYGPDCWSILLLLDYWIRDDILFSLETTYLEKGYNSVLSKYNASDTRDDPFPTSPVTIYSFNKYSVTWNSKHIAYEIGWSNIPISSRKFLSSKPYFSDGSFFLKVQLVYDIGFDLN
tara:strand:+ start:75919 stop:77352 length:1434 start_codon:yes stop_codon:yes gene_type:complete